jgi:cytolysin (calcineurin-like family phosphatase)
MKKLLAVTLVWAVLSAGAASAQTFAKPAPENIPLPWLVLGGGKAMTGLTGAGQADFPSMPDMNDMVANVVIPEGFVLAGYEHNSYGGEARLFWGSMDIKGKLARGMSSFKVRRYSTLKCAVAYEHASMTGAAWPFCLVDGQSVIADPDSGWWKQVSSVAAPKGIRLSFCGDGPRTPCRSYTDTNTAFVGNVSNDKFTEAVVSPFDDTHFRMVFMSDPQFGWGESKLRYTDAYRTWDDSSAGMAVSMTSLRMPLSGQSWGGVVVNGDITNTGDDWQLDKFDDTFGRRFDNIYPGLGNHDYDNYIGSSDNRAVFNWYDKYVSGAPGLNAYDISEESGPAGSRTKYKGSLAYSWDIGDVHFVQLNNYPSYRTKGNADVEFDISDSLDWLANDLKTRGARKRIVLNMHSLLAASFGPWDCESTCASMPADEKRTEAQHSTNKKADYARFYSIVSDAHKAAKDNIVLIFAGHLHELAGSSASYNSASAPPPAYLPEKCEGWHSYLDAPLFYTGGSQYSVHLLVDFDPSGITVQTIDSKFGVPNPAAEVRVDNSKNGKIEVRRAGPKGSGTASC